MNEAFFFSFFSSKFLWNEVCDEILTEANQHCVTPKLITQLMYAFRDIQVGLLLQEGEQQSLFLCK